MQDITQHPVPEEGIVEFECGQVELVVGPNSAVLAIAGVAAEADLAELWDLARLLADPRVRALIGFYVPSADDSEPDPASCDALVTWLERQFRSSNLL